MKGLPSNPLSRSRERACPVLDTGPGVRVMSAVALYLSPAGGEIQRGGPRSRFEACRTTPYELTRFRSSFTNFSVAAIPSAMNPESAPTVAILPPRVSHFSARS